MTIEMQINILKNQVRFLKALRRKLFNRVFPLLGYIKKLMLITYRVK